MNEFSNRNPSPVDLTEQSLEELLIAIAKSPHRITQDLNMVTRFEIVGPYCSTVQNDPGYIHTVYPLTDPSQPRYLTVLFAL